MSALKRTLLSSVVDLKPISYEVTVSGRAVEMLLAKVMRPCTLGARKPLATRAYTFAFFDSCHVPVRSPLQRESVGLEVSGPIGPVKPRKRSALKSRLSCDQRAPARTSKASVNW